MSSREGSQHSPPCFFGVLTIFTSSFIVSVEHGVMPKLFCALRCLRKKDENIRLFRIPADGFQRKRWIAAIGFVRTSPHSRICNKHFVTGTVRGDAILQKNCHQLVSW